MSTILLFGSDAENLSSGASLVSSRSMPELLSTLSSTYQLFFNEEPQNNIRKFCRSTVNLPEESYWENADNNAFMHQNQNTRNLLMPISGHNSMHNKLSLNDKKVQSFKLITKEAIGSFNLCRSLYTQEQSDKISHAKYASVKESEKKSVLLSAQPENMTSKLIRPQKQIQSLIQRKNHWFRSIHRRFPKSSAQQSSATASVHSLEDKIKQPIQSKIMAEVGDVDSKRVAVPLNPEGLSAPIPVCSTEDLKTIDKLAKALTEARENAEHLRHALKKEQSRVDDLTRSLDATHEVNHSEKKTAAEQTEIINKLNHEIDELKQQIADADRARDCETAKKYDQALMDISALKRSYVELEGKTSQEMETFQKRETQLSEFTRRLTERNAGLQADYLAAQGRLEASEKAVSLASRATHRAAALVQTTEEKLRLERAESTRVIAALETALSELSQTQTATKAELVREKAEKNALKRRQQTLDRELARLMTQQKKLLHHTPASAIPAETKGLEAKTPSKRFSSTMDLPVSASSGAKDPHQPILSTVLSHRPLISPGCTETPSKTAASYEASNRLPQDIILGDQPFEGSKIESLQRTNARLLEKINFLHDHVCQLTVELQKKSQLLQQYCVRDFDASGGSSAAVPSSADLNRQQRMLRGGSLMAAVFAGDGGGIESVRDQRALLQINHKLQTVLEDALYKNITLKDNMDTLADEVARLKAVAPEPEDLVSNRSNLY